MTEPRTLSAGLLLASLMSAVANVCEVDQGTLSRDTELEPLGVDSLVASQVIAEVEFQLDIELAIDFLEDLDEIRTIGDIADAFLAAGMATSG